MAETDFGSLAKKIRGGESAMTQAMKNIPPEFSITRRANRQGLLGSIKVIGLVVSALNSRQIVVTVNGRVVGSLNENETIRCNGIAGQNTISVRTNNGEPKAMMVNLGNGMKKRFFCGTTSGCVELREA